MIMEPVLRGRDMMEQYAWQCQLLDCTRPSRTYGRSRAENNILYKYKLLQAKEKTKLKKSYLTSSTTKVNMILVTGLFNHGHGIANGSYSKPIL